MGRFTMKKEHCQKPGQNRHYIWQKIAKNSLFYLQNRPFCSKSIQFMGRFTMKKEHLQKVKFLKQKLLKKS